MKLSALQQFRLNDYFNNYVLLFMKQVFQKCTTASQADTQIKNFCYILLAASRLNTANFNAMLVKYYFDPGEESLCKSLKVLHNLCNGSIDDGHHIIADRQELKQNKALKKTIGDILSNKIRHFLIQDYPMALHQIDMYNVVMAASSMKDS